MPAHDAPGTVFIPKGWRPPPARHVHRLLHPGGMETHELHPTRALSLASFIPEGWEPIAPGRAKHAPGDNADDYEHAPRQGCGGSRSFNPSGVVHPFPTLTRGRFAPRATRSHASGVKTSRGDRVPEGQPHLCASARPSSFRSAGGTGTSRAAALGAQRKRNASSPPSSRLGGVAALPLLSVPEGSGGEKPRSLKAAKGGTAVGESKASSPQDPL